MKPIVVDFSWFWLTVFYPFPEKVDSRFPEKVDSRFPEKVDIFPEKVDIFLKSLTVALCKRFTNIILKYVWKVYSIWIILFNFAPDI